MKDIYIYFIDTCILIIVLKISVEIYLYWTKITCEIFGSHRKLETRD